MHPPGADRVLVRHGELGVKSKQVRRKMEARLADNLRAMLDARGLSGDVERRRNRVLVRAEEPEGVTAAAADTFGVVSASAVSTVEPTLSAITGALVATAREHYHEGAFAIDAQRAGPTDAHSFSSGDIESTAGDAVCAAMEERGREPVVDLDTPDFVLFVDCRNDEAHVFCEKRAGPGGLPLGTQRPVVALISGGIDSPVAAWKLMRRGAPVVPVYVDLGEYGGPDHRARAISTVETLATYAPGHDLSLCIVEAGNVVTDLSADLGALRMVVLRRFMLAVAEAVATDRDAVGVVTGEAIGQKSSQTSPNIAATDPATSLPVHRPNLTADKSEITNRARSIGTFEDATIDTGCDRIAPAHPETNASLAAVRDAEPDDLFDRARRCARDRTVVPIES